jgi:hypothetical protein
MIGIGKQEGRNGYDELNMTSLILCVQMIYYFIIL